MTLSLVNWNIEWATPRSSRAPEILDRIGQHEPDIVCLTETHTGLLSPDGHVICSQPDYGYGNREHMRKVMLWSREPWQCVDDLGHRSMPPGRFVSGVTRTPLGKVTVVGICIPWHGSRAQARRGPVRKDWWEDQGQYLDCLSEMLRGIQNRPLIVVGDFNQRIGQGQFVPRKLRSALQSAMPEHMTIATSALGHRGRRCIDHMAVSEDLVAESLCVISNMAGEKELSDHCGIAAVLSVGNRQLGGSVESNASVSVHGSDQVQGIPSGHHAE